LLLVFPFRSPPPPTPPLFPYTTLFRSNRLSGNDLPGCTADRAERQTLGAGARVRTVRVRAVDVERRGTRCQRGRLRCHPQDDSRSEEHTSELQSLAYLVCRLLLEKKKI